MSELKPCPFCGGESTENRDISNSIYCKKCFAEIDTDCVDWNTRPIEDALHARIAELDAEVTKGHELQDAYCDRIAELEEKQRWIPVGERLPEDTERMLTIVYDAFEDTTAISILQHYGDGDWFSWDSGRYVVTHWTPLPELPKECER